MTTRGQVRNGFPAYRVYIFGIDVSNDVLDVDVQWQTGRAPNICSVTLANLSDKYIFTTNDLVAIFDDEKLRMAAERETTIFIDDIEHYVDVTPDYETIDNILLKNVKKITDEVKQKVISRKITQRIKDVEQPNLGGETGGKNIKQLTADVYRYPLQAEDPIFHANDPIRIWFRDPFESHRWYHMFAGLLSDFDDHVDENNQRILTITAEGSAKRFKWARIITNPTGFLNRDALFQAEKDAFNPCWYASGFKDLTLSELLFALVFGNDPEKKFGKFAIIRDGPNGKTVEMARMQGVGSYNFEKSVVIEYGPELKDPLKLSTTPTTRAKSLAQYQSLIDHEVKESDLQEMILEGNLSPTNIRRLSDNSADPLYIIDYIGSNPDIYPVDGGRLIILVPRSLCESVNRQILLHDIIQSASLISQFKSRLSVIYDTIERIEFTFYESPKGDLICEFPLYDFDPDDFGDSTVPHSTSGHHTEKSAYLKDDPTIERGPFNTRYKIGKGSTYNFSKSISDEKVRTQVACNWFPVQGYESFGDSSKYSDPAVITLRHLSELYGYRLEQTNPRGYISSRSAALTYAQIVLNKCNADARSLGINITPNFGVWLNRPIYFEQRNCIGLLVSAKHSIKWNSSADTRLNLRYIRGWDGLIVKKEDGKEHKVYTTIGGTPSNPLNYKLLFGMMDDVKSGAAIAPQSVEQSSTLKTGK